MAELQKRFILARASAWNAEGFNKALYNNAIVFIHNGETNETPGKCVAIYTKGVEYPIGKALSGETITKAFAGNGTVTYTTTGTKLDGTSADITALSFKQGDNIEITVDEAGALVIKGKDWSDEIADAVANKNVTASGDTYVNATVAEGTNHVTISATKEITDAVSYADSALQTVSASGSTYVSASFGSKAGENGAKSQALTVDLSESTKKSLGLADSALQAADITTGSANGTIAVKGSDVAVKGLGSAAYTESTAYDAAGAAEAVKTELKGDVESLDTLGKLEDAINTINAGAKTYTVKEITTGLGANVEIAYQLYEKVGETETAVGKQINIPKDDSLVDVATTTDAKGNKVVVFKYNLANGEYKEITLDLSAYVTESEFGEGLKVVDKVVSVKRDETSENFLTVSENGIKISGVQDAINNAIDALDVTGGTIGSKATETDTVNVIDSLTWSETDGKVSITGTTTSAATKAYVDGKFDALDAILDADEYTEETTYGYTNVITGFKQENGLLSSTTIKQLPTGIEVARQAAKATTEVVKASDSEDYLTLTSETAEDEHTKYVIGVSGIDNAISTAINGLDLGVKSVKASTTSNHVTVTPTTDTKGVVELTVNVASVDATDKTKYEATGLATDAYVDEKVATAVSGAAGSVTLTNGTGGYVFAAETAGYVTAENMANIMNEAWSWGTI